MIPRRVLMTALALTAAPGLAMAVDDGGSPAASGQAASAPDSYGAIDAAINDAHNRAAGDMTPAATGEFDAGGAGTTSGGVVAGEGALTADEVRGTIDAIDAASRSITLRDDQGNLVSYDLTAGATVKVGQRSSSLSSLNSGDTVTVTVADSDPTQARAVRVESTQ